MIRADITKERFNEAMEILRKELEQNESLFKAFNKCSLKTHPDRNEGKVDLFQVIQAVQVAVQFVKTSSPATKEEKVNFAKTLAQLPSDIRKTIVTKLSNQYGEVHGNTISNPVVFTVQNTYQHKASNPLKGRDHFFKVDATNFKNLKAEFQDSKGDYLKTMILKDFQTRIENTSSKEELDALKKELKGSDEHKVLATGQGFATKLFGLQTSSVKALETMFEEQEKNVSSPSMRKE
jgi:hypothetical protein